MPKTTKRAAMPKKMAVVADVGVSNTDGTVSQSGHGGGSKKSCADLDDMFAKGAWKSLMKDATEKRAVKEAGVQAARKLKVEERRKREREALTQKEESRKRKNPESSQNDTDSLSGASAGKLMRDADGNAVALDKELAGASSFQKTHEIVVDANCPPPFETFEAARSQLGEPLFKALAAQGYSAPTPIQAQAWPIALEGRDLVAVAKTGSGKTCGFLLPALAQLASRGVAPTPKWLSDWETEPATPSVLVLAPTRELAQQIATEAEKFVTASKARIVALFGGVAKNEQVRALQQGADVLIATPGRLLDFAAGNEKRGLKPLVTLKDVGYFVLDEADRMLDMGFEADIKKIAGQCRPSSGTGSRQTLFFTATWPKAVQKAASALTTSTAAQVRIGQSGGQLTASKSITQVVTVLEYSKKLDKLKTVLTEELKKGETAVVFAATKGGCDFLESKLKSSLDNVWCRAIHSGKEQWDRDETLSAFRALTTGSSKKPVASDRAVLVATDVAARGLDIPGVALVVVYDFSNDRGGRNAAVESYVHRIGRTGRGGKTGRAFTFFTAEDQGAYAFVELLRGAEQKVPKALQDLADWEGPPRVGTGKSAGKGKKPRKRF